MIEKLPSKKRGCLLLLGEESLFSLAHLRVLLLTARMIMDEQGPVAFYNVVELVGKAVLKDF